MYNKLNRREFLYRCGMIASGLVLGKSLRVYGQQKTKPNILIIVGDDHGYADMSCTGLASDVHTPNLDRISQMGIRFTQAYATSSICSPSRAGLETGCYQQRFGQYWYGGKGIHDPKYLTIAEILKKQGYVNGYVGKFHYGGKHNHPKHRNLPLNHGFDFLYGFGGGRKHYLHHKTEYVERFKMLRKKYNKTAGQSLVEGPIWVGRERKDQEGFTTEMIGDKAREFIRTNKDKPFYLHVGFNAVHNFTHQLPKEYLKKHNLKGYHDWDPGKEDYYPWYQQSRYPNNPEGRAHYLGQLDYMDNEIGTLLDLLDELNIADNTVIFYIGDNGGSTPIYADNGPLRGSKYTLYEGGIRVPLMIAWPKKFQQNKIRNNVVSALDILPTVCNVTGSPTPSYIDGMDITELLSGKNPDLYHETLVWDTHSETAVRHGKWKLRTASKNGHADYEMVELELGEFLYDLENDPGETTNLAGKHKDKLMYLKNIYDKWNQYIQKS